VYVSLPNGDCGDGIVNPFDKNQVADKYWAQRHRFFSRFDDGIQLDSESWFSVTPEQIADHIAERLLQSKQDGTAATTQSEQQQGLVVLDAFCGCGGNAIAFAKRPEIALVVCVDVDEAKLIKTGNNANIYNIPPEKLLLVHANACLVLKLYQNGFLVTESDRASEVKEASGYKLGSESILPKQIHAVFLSPPWGGTDYGRIGPREFDLKCIHLTDEKGDETNGEHLLIQATKATENKRVFYFLPRNTNGLQVAKSAVKAGFEGTIELEQNLINGKFKTLTAYFESSEGMDIIEKY
jgi:trimethylguanosine synthase